MKKQLLILLTVILGLTGCGQENSTQIEQDQGNIIENTEYETEIIDLHAYDFTLCFAGDISLDESAVTTAQLDAS